MSEKPLNVAVFASGGGTNFQALLDHDNDCWRIALLVMNRQGGAAARAEQGGVAVRIIPTRDREVDDVAKETQAALDESSIDVVLLAGYLRKIPSTVIDRYKGRMLNVHPALLPDFGGAGMYGMHVHRAVAEFPASPAQSQGGEDGAVRKTAQRDDHFEPVEGVDLGPQEGPAGGNLGANRLVCGGTQRTALVIRQSCSSSPSSARAANRSLEKPNLARVA